ncbi:MAG: Ig-like domain-containing protein, partial [Caldimonas sp.]
SVKDKSGRPLTGVSLSWTSSDPTVATVDATGRVLPLKVGTSTVKASASTVSGSTAVSVRAPATTQVKSRTVGTNLSGIAYYSTQFPFADLMKSSSGWTSREDNGTWNAPFPSMNPDGYPTALNPGQHAVSAVAWTDTHYLPGRYVVLWDGDGAVSFPMSDVAVAESSSNRIGIDVVRTTGQLWVSIDRTSATNPVRNVRFLWPGTEATYASQKFNPEFLKKSAPFSVVRFMDWGATNGSPVVNWADRSHVSDLTYATDKGVPLEVMIDLANSLHVDPWFCIPHQATDDYVTQFATLLHSRLDPALKPHIEYSNEVWNTGFSQTTWALARSNALGLPAHAGMPSAFYAKRAVEMFKIIQGVYGSTDSPRLVRVVSGQAAWTQFLQDALAWQDTAVNADVMAIAPYFNAAGADDVANVSASLRLSSDAIVDQMLASIRGDIKNWIVANAALAKQYGLKMKAYESGPGDTTWYFPADKIDAMTAQFAAANRNPRMRDAYSEFYGLWLANGGDTMNQYSDIGTWSKWGFWGSLEYVTQDPASAPKYQALLDFIAAHPLTP